MNGHTQRINPSEAEHKAAMDKFLADRNKVTDCVPVVSPRRRKRPVKVTGYGVTGKPDDEARRAEALRQLREYTAKKPKDSPVWSDAVDGKTGRKR